MELKDFVSQALVGIVNGVKEANEQLPPYEPGASQFVVRPGGGTTTGGKTRSGGRIFFDIAVTARSTDKVKAGMKANIVVAEFSTGGDRDRANETVSRIRFSVDARRHIL